LESAVISHVTRASTPESLEPDLAALWREVGRQGPVARAVMSNLVVFREAGAAPVDFGQDSHEYAALDAIVARHPCRLIVLEHRRDVSPSPALFAVTIRIVTFGTETSRYGVEQIAIQSACADACLPSIVNGLARGDVPTSLWWMDDLSERAPFDSVVRTCRQFVYDSRRWRDVGRGMSAAASLLGSGRRLDLADLNWRRLTAVRRALAHACNATWVEALSSGRVRVVHRPGDGALAWLAVGWLASLLRWTPDIVPAVEEARDGEAVLMVHAGDASAGLSAVLYDSQVVVSSTNVGTPVALPVPRENSAQAMAAELRNLSHDVCLHEAIRAAVSLLQ
jgi:glucose-6-phosphate dehydrogenase assembly protein OpcA